MWEHAARFSIVRSRVLDLGLALLAMLSLARFVATGVSNGIPAWFNEELPPLVRHLALEEPIQEIDRRQYGVIAFLVFDLPVRLLRGDLSVDHLSRLQGDGVPLLSWYALGVSLAASFAAFWLCARRFFGDSRRWTLLLSLGWLNFAPLLYVIAQRSVDSWQLLFLSASLFLLTGTPRQRLLSGLPVAAAVLTKLLPGVVLLYLLVRDWRAGALGLAAGALLLALGQALYGPLLGFGYPFALLSTGGDTVALWSTHYENNSLRGLVYKLGAGFRLGEGYSRSYALTESWMPLLNMLSYAAELGLLGYLLLVAWRNRGNHHPARRAIEYSLAIATMLLVSPHTAHDYMAAMLPGFSVLAFAGARRIPGRWPPLLAIGAAASALLIGVFVPLSLALRLLPMEALVATTGNSANTYLATQIGYGFGAYHFFGFPGAGLILSWLVLVSLERRCAAGAHLTRLSHSRRTSL